MFSLFLTAISGSPSNMLETLFDQTVDTKRLVDGDGNQLEYEDLLTDVPCAIQQSDAKISMDLVGSFGKDWLMFCAADTDIQEGDRVIWNEKEYKVEAVDRLGEFVSEAHMEILLRIFES